MLAGDNYFADLYGVTKAPQRWLNSLERNKHITRKVKYKENSKEISERRIYISPSTLYAKIGIPYTQKCDNPIRKNEGDNNTLINNTDRYIYIVEYLNKATGKNYRHTTKKTRSLIDARMKEGFTEDDFIKVIDNKVKSWQALSGRII